MHFQNLTTLGGADPICADLVIVGGGPAGLTIAREFIGTSIDVLVVESGERSEEPQYAALNAVESIGEPRTKEQRHRRTEFHGSNARFWSSTSQVYGVRCRVLGGASQVWAGKVAAFDELDFSNRPWVPHSGWPFGREALDPYLSRAADLLNLGPNCYDEKLWDLIGSTPEPCFDPNVLISIFWQFSRSRIDNLDIMRFGRDLAELDAPNVQVLLNATATRIDVNEERTCFQALEIATINGARSRVHAKAVVLAAGAIENARLLLASKDATHNGVGNQNDVVGRFLLDHPGARIGRFGADACDIIERRFGFYGVRHGGRTHLCMHGLALSKELQEREQLVQCALYMLEERAPDDPWDAMKRLLRGKSVRPMSDVVAIASSPGLVAKGLGMRLFYSDVMPQTLRRRAIDAVLRYKPNLAVREHQNRGLPHKLIGYTIDGIAEQAPDPDSRVTLSSRVDALGVPLPRVCWRIGDEARRSLLRLAQLLATEMSRTGLPSPILEDWVVRQRPEDCVLIDMAHTLGTTRMSADPKKGVVNDRCQVHGIRGLYIAGGSVFPTCGHANPTLMILALAIRLADHIKDDLAR